jgi:hypothetical protein
MTMMIFANGSIGPSMFAGVQLSEINSEALHYALISGADNQHTTF